MKESRLFSEAAARTVAEEIYTKKEALFYQLFGTRKCALWSPPHLSGNHFYPKKKCLYVPNIFPIKHIKCISKEIFL